MIYKITDIADITEETFAKYWSMLSEYKKKKMTQLKNADDRMLTFAGEMLARQCLAEITGAPEFSFEILADEYGKCIVSNFHAEFNISHSGSKAMCAADVLPLGADIERIRPFTLGVAQRVCTPEEMLYIFSGSRENFADFISSKTCSEKKAVENFYLIWTLKEAYFKATGRGVRDDMRSVSFDFKPSGVTVSDSGYEVLENNITFDGAYAMSIVRRK